jgi:acyl-coenzyme A thioesterase 9
MFSAIFGRRILHATANTKKLPSTSPYSLRCFRRRTVQTLAEFRAWREEIRRSALPSPGPSLQRIPLSDGAPFLYSVSPITDRLELCQVVRQQDEQADSNTPTVTKSSPRQSLLQCKYPLETDALLRNTVADFSNWSSFRLGKFYEIVDALTADVAYRHAADDDNNSQEVTFVTAGHYHSRKFQKTDIQKDVVLRCYVTHVGRSSMEVRTDALQQQCPDEKEMLLNVCHTIMVALDSATMKPLSKVGKQLPSLVMETVDDEQRLELAKKHQEMRSRRSAQAMLLRSPVSVPPTFEEMKRLHQLHVHRARTKEQHSFSAASSASTGNSTKDDPSSPPPMVSDFTFRSSTVIFPEKRNVHGKLFGGFVMDEAQKLAQYTATFFAHGASVIPLGIDEAIFLQPIAVGDMVTFTARLVHSTETTCRVLVIVEVRDPSDAARVPIRSNRLMFVFGGNHFRAGIVPNTYQEILMHLDAQRRHLVEGPTDEEVRQILQEASNTQE